MKKIWKIIIGIVVIGTLSIFLLNSTRKEPIGPVTQTSVREISLTDSEVYEILTKFNFLTSTEASIYKAGNFDKTSIPNDLILRMAWDKICMKETHREVTEEKSTLTGSEESMEKSIYNLFGNEITFTNQSFENIDCQTFAGYSVNPGTVFYENGQYVADYLEGGGGSVPYLYQVVQNAEEHGVGEIHLFVKTAFIDTFYDENREDFTYNLYSDFDFATEKFENQVTSCTEEEFFEKIPEMPESFQSLRMVDNGVFESVKDKLNTYEYIFQKDSATGEFILLGFSKI